MNELVNNQSPNENTTDNDEIYFILPAGLIPGAIITRESIRRAAEAERMHEEKSKNRRNKPPKPPRRPNIPLGRLALGES